MSSYKLQITFGFTLSNVHVDSKCGFGTIKHFPVREGDPNNNSSLIKYITHGKFDYTG